MILFCLAMLRWAICISSYFKNAQDFACKKRDNIFLPKNARSRKNKMNRKSITNNKCLQLQVRQMLVLQQQQQHQIILISSVLLIQHVQATRIINNIFGAENFANLCAAILLNGCYDVLNLRKLLLCICCRIFLRFNWCSQILYVRVC